MAGAFAVPREELVRGEIGEMVVRVLRVIDDAPVDPPVLGALACNGCTREVLIQLVGGLVIRGGGRLELEPTLIVFPERVGEARDVASVGELGELQIRWLLRPQVGVQRLACSLTSSRSAPLPFSIALALTGAFAVAGSTFGPKTLQEPGDSAKPRPRQQQDAAARWGRERLPHGIELATLRAAVPRCVVFAIATRLGCTRAA